MNLNDLINKYKTTYDVLAVIDLDHWHDLEFYKKTFWLRDQISKLHKENYENNQRIIFTLSQGEEYKTTQDKSGMILENLQQLLNQVDISNFFVVVMTNDRDGLEFHKSNCQKHSKDPVSINWEVFDDPPLPENKRVTDVKIPKYSYSSSMPIGITLEELDEKERFLLTQSSKFCMYPWTHLHTIPTGKALPCCMAEHHIDSLGDCRQQPMKEIWNSDRMKLLRTRMLNEQEDPFCTRCYEKEENGFFSGRQSANKHHGHHIHRIKDTKEDGTYDDFKMVYWDIRFSNLCNLRCRSCGHFFSSQWYQDQAKLAGPEWKSKNKPLMYAGRFETDMLEQLLDHLDHVEQIYFAGGEPLMMEEHYHILEELERRKRFDVRLIYNTNFTQVKLKDRYVFDYWKKFNSVAVGASLDDSGARGEYIRKGTQWDEVEENRVRMMEICPNVDFYISPTLSILNAWHLPDFHREWVEKGLIRPKDFIMNLVQDPIHLRLDIAPPEYKNKIKQKFLEHLEWLRPQDHLERATQGFEAAINYMMATDNSQWIPLFKEKMQQLDTIRKENLLSVIPELGVMYENTTR